MVIIVNGIDCSPIQITNKDIKSDKQITKRYTTVCPFGLHLLWEPTYGNLIKSNTNTKIKQWSTILILESKKNETEKTMNGSTTIMKDNSVLLTQ